jgi:hypothetical protein
MRLDLLFTCTVDESWRESNGVADASALCAVPTIVQLFSVEDITPVAATRRSVLPPSEEQLIAGLPRSRWIGADVNGCCHVVSEFAWRDSPKSATSMACVHAEI